jgi:hypothetical protein
LFALLVLHISFHPAQQSSAQHSTGHTAQRGAISKGHLRGFIAKSKVCFAPEPQ